MESRERHVKPGELLAINPGSLHAGPKGVFWMLGIDPTRPNERHGDVAVMHVRGELEHHEEYGCDSYERILKNLCTAVEGDGDGDADDAHGPPSTVLMCIDSPGGVVAGLNETVKSIQKYKKQHGFKLVAYANELAASAAYALSCACDEIVCPPSAIIGSIGVISTMVSVSRADKENGIDVVLITSGERKADGHVHAPINRGAVQAERDRLEKSATAFFALVSESRGLKPSTIRSYQAGIFLGKDARKRGLVDRVASYDETLAALSGTSSKQPKKAGGNETDRRMKRANLTHYGSACHGTSVAHLIPRRI